MNFELMNTQFVLQPVRTVGRMREVLRTRFEVYSVTPHMCHLDSLDRASGLDLDVFDQYSHHLALVARSNDLERVVGTLRVVTDRLNPQAALLASVTAPHARLRARLSAVRPALLPLLSYLVQAPAIRPLVDACRARGERVAEPSRLAVRPDARRLAAKQGGHISAFMVEAALAYGFLEMGLDQVFLDCVVPLKSLYGDFGFAVLPGAEAAYQPLLRADAVAMTARHDGLPRGLAARIKTMAGELAQTGEIAFRPSEHARRALAAA